jgi:hypothetical protein
MITPDTSDKNLQNIDQKKLNTGQRLCNFLVENSKLDHIYKNIDRLNAIDKPEKVSEFLEESLKKMGLDPEVDADDYNAIINKNTQDQITLLELAAKRIKVKQAQAQKKLEEDERKKKEQEVLDEAKRLAKIREQNLFLAQTLANQPQKEVKITPNKPIRSPKEKKEAEEEALSKFAQMIDSQKRKRELENASRKISKIFGDETMEFPTFESTNTLKQITLTPHFEKLLQTEVSESDPKSIEALLYVIKCLGNPSKLISLLNFSSSQNVSNEATELAQKLDNAGKDSKLVESLSRILFTSISDMLKRDKITDIPDIFSIDTKQIIDEIYQFIQSPEFLSRYIPKENYFFSSQEDDIDHIRKWAKFHYTPITQHINPGELKKMSQRRASFFSSIALRYHLVYKFDELVNPTTALSSLEFIENVLIPAIQESKRRQIDFSKPQTNPVPQSMPQVSLYYDATYGRYTKLKSVLSEKPLDSESFLEIVGKIFTRPLPAFSTDNKNSRFDEKLQKYAKESFTKCYKAIVNLPTSNIIQSGIIAIFTDPDVDHRLTGSMEQLLESQEDLFISIAKELLKHEQNILSYLLTATPEDFRVK